MRTQRKKIKFKKIIKFLTRFISKRTLKDEKCETTRANSVKETSYMFRHMYTTYLHSSFISLQHCIIKWRRKDSESKTSLYFEHRNKPETRLRRLTVLFQRSIIFLLSALAALSAQHREKSRHTSRRKIFTFFCFYTLDFDIDK